MSFRKMSTMLLLQDKDIVSLSAGDTHALALSKTGEVWAWGCNMAGQLGDGTISCSARPVRVRRGVLTNESNGTHGGSMGCAVFLREAVKVAAGGAHSVVATEDGRVLTWGCGNCGQLGDGATKGSWPGLRLHAGVVLGLAGVHVVEVAAGAFHTLALGANGDIYAWGFNAHGQIGDGTTTSCSSPRRILAGALSIAAGYAHSLALTSCNATPPNVTMHSTHRLPRGVQVWSWGLNHRGQLGDGPCSSRTSPALSLSTLSERLPAWATAVRADCRDGPPNGVTDWRIPCVAAGGHTSAVIFCPQATGVLPAMCTSRARASSAAAAASPNANTAHAGRGEQCHERMTWDIRGMGRDQTLSEKGLSLLAPSWSVVPGQDARTMVLIQEEAGEVVGMHALDEHGWWVLASINCMQTSLPIILPHSCLSRSDQRSANAARCQEDGMLSVAGCERHAFGGVPLAMVAYGAGPDQCGEKMVRPLDQASSRNDAAYYVMSLESGGSWLDGRRLSRGVWHPLHFGSVLGVGQVSLVECACAARRSDEGLFEPFTSSSLVWRVLALNLAPNHPGHASRGHPSVCSYSIQAHVGRGCGAPACFA